jgi:hypothetical protein
VDDLADIYLNTCLYELLLGRGFWLVRPVFLFFFLYQSRESQMKSLLLTCCCMVIFSSLFWLVVSH